MIDLLCCIICNYFVNLLKNRAGGGGSNGYFLIQDVGVYQQGRTNQPKHDSVVMQSDFRERRSCLKDSFNCKKKKASVVPFFFLWTIFPDKRNNFLKLNVKCFVLMTFTPCLKLKRKILKNGLHIWWRITYHGKV